MATNDGYAGSLPLYPTRIEMDAIERRGSNENGLEPLEVAHSKISKRPHQRVFAQYVRRVVPPRTRKQVDRTDGEYDEEYTCDPPAVCMVLISIIEISFYIAQLSHMGFDQYLIYNPHRRAEVWRFLTYIFVHAGPFHLIVNVVIQLFLAVPLEMVHRWWRVMLVYLAGVIAGSLGTSISDPNVYLAGASGGVYALMTAHVATIIMNWSEMNFAFGQLMIFLVLIVTDVGTSIYNRYFVPGEQKIAYAAHFAGALAGLLFGLYILRNLEVHKWEKKLARIAALTYCILMLIFIVFHFVNPGYFPKQENFTKIY